MFQFPRFAFVSYVFGNKYLLLISASPNPGRPQNSELQISKVGCPIRKFTDQSLFAAPRDLSQRTTSFIASQRQGIHRTPLRHLITLIIDARRPFLMGEQDRQKKDQFLRDLPDRSGLSLRVRATDPSRDLGQTFSSRCQKTRGSDPSGRTRIRIFREMGLKPPSPSCPRLDRGGQRRDSRRAPQPLAGLPSRSA